MISSVRAQRSTALCLRRSSCSRTLTSIKVVMIGDVDEVTPLLQGDDNDEQCFGAELNIPVRNAPERAG